ncbi:hypothetical protein WJX82_008235 [Trebouxia sp. C0006]
MADTAQPPPLQELLRKAVRAPDCIHTQDGGAVLALAVHCLFIEAGFTNVDYVRGSPYHPDPEWNRSHDAWIFQYKKKGCANTFTYQCGLKQHTGQAYVHVTEDNGGDNVSFMGLILHKYVKNVAALRQDTWQGVVSNEDDLRKFFDNYIMQPVLTKAVPGSEDQQGDRQDYRTKLTAVGVAAIVALLVWKVKGSQ